MLMQMSHSKKRRIVQWAGIAALVLAFFAIQPVQAQLLEPDAPPVLLEGGELIQVQNPRQIFRDDLTVESGQVIAEDVFVYSGDVDIDEGGRITGDLIVFSGNVDLAEGAAVEGDLINYSGNLLIAGHVGGDLAAMSGNVELESTARVDGDISVVSGRIDRAEGATVGGNVVQGPTFRFPRRDAPDAPEAVNDLRLRSGSPGFFGTLLHFIERLLVAALMTALVLLLVGGLFYLRPQLIRDTRQHLNEQLALSAVVGVLANLTVLFLAGLLAITICLLPLALLPMLALLAVNVVGWSVASQIVGERVVAVAKQEVQPALTILVGALLLTGVCALLWAMGGCFRFIAFLVVFAVSSLGAGAVLVPWINRRGIGGAGASGGGDGPPSGPTPTVPPTPGGATQPEADTPLVYTAGDERVAGEQASGTMPAAARGATTSTAGTGETVLAGEDAPQDASQDVSGDQEVVEHDVAAPIDYMTAEEINSTAEQARKPQSRSRRTSPTALTPDITANEPRDREAMVEQDVAAPVDYVTAQEVNTTEALSEGDDFLEIKGIGPTYARRLKDAGYASFGDLAAASPEDVAAAIGWSVDRVRGSELIDQAKVLAQRS